MRWENMNWQHGRNGAVLVTHGKTAAARRSIPMTPRVRFILETRWDFAGKPRLRLGVARAHEEGSR